MLRGSYLQKFNEKIGVNLKALDKYLNGDENS